MRCLIFLYLTLILPAWVFADAGFNIRREKAPCYAVFTGIDKLNDYEFFKIPLSDREDDRIDSSNFLKNNDTVQIYYTAGRRYWQGPIKILVRSKATQQFVDSFTLVADGNNLTLNFTGVENNKPAYTVSKTKAEYPYALYGDGNVDTATAKRNKYILIAMSAIGFLLLFFMISKRKKSESQNKTA